MAMQRATDLAQLNVDIELFPMPRPDAVGSPSFDVRKFYANIITFDEEQQCSELLGLEGNSCLFQLMKRIRQKEFRKRT